MTFGPGRAQSRAHGAGAAKVEQPEKPQSQTTGAPRPLAREQTMPLGALLTRTNNSPQHLTSTNGLLSLHTPYAPDWRRDSEPGSGVETRSPAQPDKPLYITVRHHLALAAIEGVCQSTFC